MKNQETFLHQEAAADVEERILEVNKSFTSPAIVGGLVGAFSDIWPLATLADDSDRLDLAPSAHDLIIHAMALHWADDPIGQLVQSRLALKPDGLFVAAFLGGQTLHELRTSLAEAEAKLTGGLSPRVLPMGDLRDLGGLLQRAGFALPVADNRTIRVRYKCLSDLVRDLRGMGETNALISRHRRVPPRALFELAESIYASAFKDADGYLIATFELVFLTGWSPDASQPQPLRPGSAASRLSDALGVDEHSANDPSNPEQR